MRVKLLGKVLVTLVRVVVLVRQVVKVLVEVEVKVLADQVVEEAKPRRFYVI